MLRCRLVRTAVATFALIVLGAPGVRADPKEAAAAEALFDEGRRLLREGRTEEACEKLRASNSLDPAVGTLLNLADCHARLGRLATAWAEFREAGAWAERDADPERARLAARRAGEIEPSVPRLTIHLEPGASVEGLSLTRDGSDLPIESLDTALPVDAGEHVIVVRAPHRIEWRTTVTVSGRGATTVLSIPPLQLASSGDSTIPVAKASGAAVLETPVVTRPPAVAPTHAATPTREPTASSFDTRRGIALAAGSVGVLGVAVGSFFGLRAMSRWSDAKGGCRSPPTECTSEAVQLGRDADGDATLASIAMAVGGVGIGAGTWLWLTTPGEPRPGTARLVLRGRF